MPTYESPVIDGHALDAAHCRSRHHHRRSRLSRRRVDHAPDAIARSNPQVSVTIGRDIFHVAERRAGPVAHPHEAFAGELRDAAVDHSDPDAAMRVLGEHQRRIERIAGVEHRSAVAGAEPLERARFVTPSQQIVVRRGVLAEPQVAARVRKDGKDVRLVVVVRVIQHAMAGG